MVEGQSVQPGQAIRPLDITLLSREAGERPMEVSIRNQCEEDRLMGRLDLGLSDWSLQTQLQALKALHNDPNQQDMSDIRNRPPPRVESQGVRADSENSAIESVLSELDLSRSQESQTILNGTSVRDVLLRAFQTDYLPPITSTDAAHAVVPDTTAMRPTDIDATPLPTPHAQAESRGLLARDQLIQSWTRRYRSPEPLAIEGDPHIPLNATQLRAIAMMLSERVSLVQGPPGTGKTRVIVETIKLLKAHWKIPHPILVSAHTNVAVDNLLAGLREHGIKALRHGSYHSVREDLQQYTLDQLIENHPMFPEIDEMKKDREQVDAEIRSGGQGKGAHPGDRDTSGLIETDYNALKQRVAELRGRIYGLENLMTREVLLSADVVSPYHHRTGSLAHRSDLYDLPVGCLTQASRDRLPHCLS